MCKTELLINLLSGNISDKLLTLGEEKKKKNFEGKEIKKLSLAYVNTLQIALHFFQFEVTVLKFTLLFNKCLQSVKFTI